MSLTPKQRFEKALNRETTDRPPIWFMRQAGRYLPEYKEIRKNKTFEQMIQDPEIATTITLQPIKRFDLDAAIIFTDILTPIYPLKIGLTIKQGIGPIIEKPINTPDKVNNIEITTPEEHYSYLIDEVKMTRKELKKHALIGFAGAPFTIASYLIEGKSTRDANKTKAFAWKYPEKYHELLSKVTEIIINKLKAQIKNNVDAVQLFDSWANYLSPKQYEILARPYVEKILNNPEISKKPVIYYSRGTSHLIEKISQLNVTAISIDHTISISQARKETHEKFVIQGNLDPAVLLSTAEKTREETMKIAREGRKTPGYIFNLSKGIDKNTPLENVEIMVNTVKQLQEA